MTEIAIIGDRFMLPSVFKEKIEAACGTELNIRTIETAWPDEPMEHGYLAAGLDGLKEYFGSPERC
jgi:D-3-phosphoglycerate dehydrogenase / 2-oxoglutarate reductase